MAAKCILAVLAVAFSGGGADARRRALASPNKDLAAHRRHLRPGERVAVGLGWAAVRRG